MRQRLSVVIWRTKQTIYFKGVNSVSESNHIVSAPKSPSFIDLTGHKFGRLTVKGFSHSKNRKTYWHCQCECKNLIISRGDQIKSGITKSCGCYMKEVTQQLGYLRKKHGHSRSIEYDIWCHIIKRCEDENYCQYHHYGGRGITICEDWRKDFMSFFNHVGPRPSQKHSIDRIDNSLGYQPGNVHWATASEQARNRRTNVLVTYNEQTKCLTEWADITGINFRTLLHRKNKGWCDNCIITKPVAKKGEGKISHTCTHR